MRKHFKVHLNKYSTSDWDVMAYAFEVAHHLIGHHPETQRDRLARTIMDFYDRGIRDVRLLSTISTNHEVSLITAERTSKRASASFESDGQMVARADYIDGNETSILVH